MTKKIIEPDEEIVDLVDENDQVIGEVKRTEANQNPKLIHREIWVLIYDRARRILFNMRAMTKMVHPGFWALVGGHIFKGEEPLMAAHRELLEEMGFDANLVFVGKVLSSENTERRFFYCYLAKYSGEKVDFQKEEMSEVRFFSAGQLEKLTSTGEKVAPSSLEMAKRFWNGEWEKYAQ